MKQCPGCDYLVPEAWDECRRCGSPLGAVAPTGDALERVGTAAETPAPSRPAAVAPAAAPRASAGSSVAHTATDEPSSPWSALRAANSTPASADPSPESSPDPTVTSAASPFATPTSAPAPGSHETDGDPVGFDDPASDDLPGDVGPAPPRHADDLIGRTSPTSRSAVSLPDFAGRRPRPRAIAAVVLALVAIWWLFIRDDGSSDAPEASAVATPVVEVLPEIGADGALPSVGDVARVEGELNLQRASLIVHAAYAEYGSYLLLDPPTLASFEPGLTWLDGTQPSTSADAVSVAVEGAARITVAVHAGEGVCAVMYDDGSGGINVTVRADQPCAAAALPMEEIRSSSPNASGATEPLPAPAQSGAVDRALELAEITDQQP